MIMMFMIKRSEYDDDVSMLMMFLIEISKYDDDGDVVESIDDDDDDVID